MIQEKGVHDFIYFSNVAYTLPTSEPEYNAAPNHLPLKHPKLLYCPGVDLPHGHVSFYPQTHENPAPPLPVDEDTLETLHWNYGCTW